MVLNTLVLTVVLHYIFFYRIIITPHLAEQLHSSDQHLTEYLKLLQIKMIDVEMILSDVNIHVQQIYIY